MDSLENINVTNQREDTITVFESSHKSVCALRTVFEESVNELCYCDDKGRPYEGENDDVRAQRQRIQSCDTCPPEKAAAAADL